MWKGHQFSAEWAPSFYPCLWSIGTQLQRLGAGHFEYLQLFRVHKDRIALLKL
jgi:hypothetical protein